MKPSDASRPHIIILVGIPGSGKSFFAERFSDTFKAPLISFNKISQAVFNNPKFDDSEFEIVNKLANYMLDELFKSGRIIIYEGATDQRGDRANLAKKAHSAGYDPIFVWVQAEIYEAKRRSIKSTDGRQAISSDQFDSRVKKFSPPHISERAVVISGKHTYNTQLKAVLKTIVTPSIKPMFINSPNTNRPTIR